MINPIFNWINISNINKYFILITWLKKKLNSYRQVICLCDIHIVVSTYLDLSRSVIEALPCKPWLCLSRLILSNKSEKISIYIDVDMSDFFTSNETPLRESWSSGSFISFLSNTRRQKSVWVFYLSPYME